MATGDSTVRDIDFFESIDNIRIINNAMAIDIDREKAQVQIKDRDSKLRSFGPFDKLILATGALPVIPDITGIDQPGIHTLRSLEDAEAIKDGLATGQARDVYIIGGGLIGISASEEF